jgi:hypothetical protein
MSFTTVYGGTVGECNVALAAAIGLINPLAAQIDLMLALGLGPLEFDLALQFNAALALQASLSISMVNPLEAIQLAIQALASLQASLAASLALPMPSISADISVAASLAGALSAKLGGLKVLIAAALAIKIPAIAWAAEFAASFGLGPLLIQTFESPQLNSAGAEIAGAYNSGLTYHPPSGGGDITLGATDGPVYGIILTTQAQAAYTALTKILTVP